MYCMRACVCVFVKDRSVKKLFFLLLAQELFQEILFMWCKDVFLSWASERAANGRKKREGIKKEETIKNNNWALEDGKVEFFIAALEFRRRFFALLDCLAVVRRYNMLSLTKRAKICDILNIYRRHTHFQAPISDRFPIPEERDLNYKKAHYYEWSEIVDIRKRDLIYHRL